MIYVLVTFSHQSIRGRRIVFWETKYPNADRDSFKNSAPYVLMVFHRVSRGLRALEVRLNGWASKYAAFLYLNIDIGVQYISVILHTCSHTYVYPGEGETRCVGVSSTMELGGGR